jgi:hypothetical protein
MTATVHQLPASDFEAAYIRKCCTAARATILGSPGNWPLMIDSAVILAENGDDGDRAFAQAVMDDYTAHADNMALVATIRREWWKLPLAVIAGVAVGMLIMEGL